MTRRILRSLPSLSVLALVVVVAGLAISGQESDDFIGIVVETDGSGGGAVGIQGQGGAPVSATEGEAGLSTESGPLGTLVPIPEPGTLFAGWEGVCQGYGPCEIPQGSTGTHTARFEAAPLSESFGNDDALSDLLAYDPTSGAVHLSLQAPAGGFEALLGQTGPAGQVPYAADFDGDGKRDLLLHDPSTGAWTELRGAAMGFVAAASVQPPVGTGWVAYPPDMDSDYRADLLVYDPGTGAWWRRRTRPVSQGEPGTPLVGAPIEEGVWPAGLTLVAGNFNGDPWLDVFAYQPSSGEW